MRKMETQQVIADHVVYVFDPFGFRQKPQTTYSDAARSKDFSPLILV